MYIPEPYAVTDREVLYGVIEENNFGLLINQADGAPFATHLPFLIEGDVLVAHMARANPQWRSFAADREVLCVFQGPHAYISPRWRQSTDTVPTWNYVAVHVYGVPEIIDDPATALAAQVEKGLVDVGPIVLAQVVAHSLDPGGMVNQTFEDLAALDDVLQIQAVSAAVALDFHGAVPGTLF